MDYLNLKEWEFYKGVVVPTALYASETWILSNKDRKNVTSAEMTFLRAVKGFSLTDRTSNKSVREKNENLLFEK